MSKEWSPCTKLLGHSISVVQITQYPSNLGHPCDYGSPCILWLWITLYPVAMFHYVFLTNIWSTDLFGSNKIGPTYFHVWKILGVKKCKVNKTFLVQMSKEWSPCTMLLDHSIICGKDRTVPLRLWITLYLMTMDHSVSRGYGSPCIL